MRIKCTTADVKQPVSKATICHGAVAKEHRVWPFMYHCVGEDWQHTVCKSLGVHFKQAVKVGSGRADLPLTRPNMPTTVGDKIKFPLCTDSPPTCERSCQQKSPKCRPKVSSDFCTFRKSPVTATLQRLYAEL